MDFHLDMRAGNRQDRPVQELWPLQGAAIHGLGVGGPQRVPRGGGPGGVTD